jgi:hypothetical protein
MNVNKAKAMRQEKFAMARRHRQTRALPRLRSPNRRDDYAGTKGVKS